MTKKVQFTLDYNQDVDAYLHEQFPSMKDYRILNQALDARGANRGKIPRYTYNIEILEMGEHFEALRENFPKVGGF